MSESTTAEPISADLFRENLFALFTETFESSPRPGSIYLDKKAGLFDTLDVLEAEQASQERNGATIAAQVAHTAFYIRALERYLDGFTGKTDWNESWRTKEVTPDEWAALKRQLREDYERVVGKLRALQTWSDESLGVGMAIVVHSAYHLGAIRQLAKQVLAKETL